MKNFRLTLLTGLVILGLGACAGRKRIDTFVGASSAQAAGVMTVRTGWVKDKKNDFNAELWFINDSAKPIVVPTSRIACSRGNQTGAFRFTGFGAWMMELQPGEQKKLIAVCNIGSKNVGEWSFTFRDVSASNDDGTAGKVLAKELVLKLTPAPKS